MPATDDLSGSSFRLPFAPRDDEVLLTRTEAARYLRTSVPTLERWSRLHMGPPPVRLPGGTVRYRLSDLRALAQGKAA